MSGENKGKPPRPQLRHQRYDQLKLPGYDQLKLPRYPVEPPVEAIAERVREEEAQEQTSGATPVKEPVNEPTPLPAAAETTPPASEPAPSADPVVGSAATTSEPAADKEPEQAAPLRRKRPRAWAAAWMKANPRREGEDKTAYAQRMCGDMAKAPDVTEAWPFYTCRRFLYRKPRTTDFAPDAGIVFHKPKARTSN